MKYLLDTHVLLWWVAGDPRISREAREVIADSGSELYFSAASSWEIAIKVGLGRLKLPKPPRVWLPRILREQAIIPLEITHAHALQVAELPGHHRDPFDRILAAQAKIERLVMISSDRLIPRYGLDMLW